MVLYHTREYNYIVEEDSLLFVKYRQTCAHRLYLLHLTFSARAEK